MCGLNVVCNNAGVMFHTDESSHSDELISINLVSSSCPFAIISTLTGKIIYFRDELIFPIYLASSADIILFSLQLRKMQLY
jgi:short-subunit dehydrogenase involved in D-alanine esterification of teichoic acids